MMEIHMHCFFEAHGNIIEIFNNDKKINEYGEQLLRLKKYNKQYVI